VTILFPIYGLFHSLHLIHIRGGVAAPDEVLLKDRPIQLTVVLWGGAVVRAAVLESPVAGGGDQVEALNSAGPPS
jgi:hypothetical protein